MKASDIYNKAKEQILTFAKIQANNIVDWYIMNGIFEKAEEYELNPSEFNVSISVEVDVQDTYTLDFSTEKKNVLSIVVREDGVALVLEGEEDYEPIYLRSLSLRQIVDVTDTLEQMWFSLVHPKKN